MSGIFITFEGIDFSGKTEQCHRLVARLESAGYEVELIREPGGVEIAEAIRQILLDSRNTQMNDRTELLLYSAARAQITQEKILPALQAGKIVIADRYVDSTTAYQGYGRRLAAAFVQAVNGFATANTKPDVTFLLDIPLEVARDRQHRAGLRKDRLENEEAEFHQRVRQAYRQLAQAESQRFTVLDGTQSPDAIAAKVVETLRQKFELKL